METLRLELGPHANKDVHKLILPDGRDIMPDLAPTQIDISIKAGGFTQLVIQTELARNIVVEVMPEHVKIECPGDSLLGERTEALAEAVELLEALLSGPKGKPRTRPPEYYEGISAAHDALQAHFWPPDDEPEASPKEK